MFDISILDSLNNIYSKIANKLITYKDLLKLINNYPTNIQLEIFEGKIIRNKVYDSNDSNSCNIFLTKVHLDVICLRQDFDDMMVNISYIFKVVDFSFENNNITLQLDNLVIVQCY